jgi:replicative superfamily II helicase
MQELLDLQIEALEMKSKHGELKGGYLDDKIRRVIINMPTSAGKSLIAELALAKLFSNEEAQSVYTSHQQKH